MIEHLGVTDPRTCLERHQESYAGRTFWDWNDFILGPEERRDLGEVTSRWGYRPQYGMSGHCIVQFSQESPGVRCYSWPYGGRLRAHRDAVQVWLSAGRESRLERDQILPNGHPALQ